MGDKTKISWCDATWNPIEGCTPISEGCANCYAQAILHRWAKPKTPTFHPERLPIPYHWKKPRRIFVCSMSDFFHDQAEAGWRTAVLGMMLSAHWHTYMILTKRPREGGLVAKVASDHIWMGVTVESQEQVWRKVALQGAKWQRRFLSCEPLLGPLSLGNLAGFDLVIAGPETGPRARPCRREWINQIREQCRLWDVEFHEKKPTGRVKWEN